MAATVHLLPALSQLVESFDEVYELGTELGRGAFSTVFVAKRRDKQTEHALKVVQKSQAITKLESEIALSMQVDHAGLVKVSAVYETSTSLGLEMELLFGKELFDAICDMELAYSEHDAANVIAQLVDIVQYLNRIGIAHRDIKPENIIYVDKNAGPDSKVKLTDLGLAKSRGDSDKQMMTPCGTPSYVAPEVLKQSGYGFECDMWSIGVITYILLCGYQPFWEDPPMLYSSIMAGSYTMPAEEWDFVSDLAKDLIQKLLVVDPGQRLTPAEVLDHAWIRGHVHKTLEPGVLPNSTSIKLKEFNAKRSFRMAGLKVMASLRMGMKPTSQPQTLPDLPNNAPCEGSHDTNKSEESK